eukprot:04186.XXX_93468_93686_1 [CDS] Oithona nana genome sequencing.
MAVTICQESLLRLYLYEMLSHQESLSALLWPDLNCYPGNSQNLELLEETLLSTAAVPMQALDYFLTSYNSIM